MFQKPELFNSDVN